MTAKDARCTICGNPHMGSGKVCPSCMKGMYASHEWHQALKECRALERTIKQTQAKKRQIKRSATVTWISRKRGERE